jgi:hypothetical protein
MVFGWGAALAGHIHPQSKNKVILQRILKLVQKCIMLKSEFKKGCGNF